LSDNNILSKKLNGLMKVLRDPHPPSFSPPLPTSAFSLQPSTFYVEVVVDKYVDKSFDYLFPISLGTPTPGNFVRVPFHKGSVVGCVVKVKRETSIALSRLKSVLSRFEENVSLSPELFKLAQWMSEYYVCPLGLVLKTFIPPSIFRGTQCRSEKEKNSSSEIFQKKILTQEQESALKEIQAVLQKNQKKTFLLWGVTGSGKTEVYLRSIAEVRARGLGALLIVPEIILTPQLVERISECFQEPLAVFHSRLTQGERAENWRRVAEGKIQIVVGARSAIFAPVKKLGLIVVDEEHEKTYKQEEAPRYNARDLAVVRGTLEPCVVILGSATPSLESYWNCQQGKYTLLRLPTRISKYSLPLLHVVDMNHERKTQKGLILFSRQLLSLIGDRLQKKEQTILFLNRRGFSTGRVCSVCGESVRCSQCSIALTYHREKNLLCCHHCDKSLPPPTLCPQCQSPEMRWIGFGTERVEKQIKALFPQARLARLDTDTLRKKGTLENVLGKLKSNTIDILIGTQMVAKGLDEPNVTLVGIIAADLALNIPDFRSEEITFQLITQVAGRAGRGDKKGEVLIQTDSVHHPVLQDALRNDSNSFFERELKSRKAWGYPPHSHFILLTLTDTDWDRLQFFSEHFYDTLKKNKNFHADKVWGPAPAPILKIRGKYRMQILMASKQIKALGSFLQNHIRTYFSTKQKNILIDVDPQSML
jgi:primosomal protein N' (replication factor Y)